MLNRRSIVLVISDFMDEGFEKALRVVARRHDAIGVRLEDPRERALPRMGLIELTDAETGETTIVDTNDRRVREAFAAEAEARRATLDDLFRRIGMDHMTIRMEEGYVEPLIRFFRHRNRTRT